MSKAKTYLKAILVPVLIGSIVGLIITPFMDYSSLQKPAFAPPGFIFPIVWTILYVLMGVSYGILKVKNLATYENKQIYYQQLIINILWPIFFFVFKWRLFAFVWILLLDIAIYMMIIRFYKSDKTAGLLQVPYFLWTLFATYLNFSIYFLNRG